jgi:hypothetical protein
MDGMDELPTIVPLFQLQIVHGKIRPLLPRTASCVLSITCFVLLFLLPTLSLCDCSRQSFTGIGVIEVSGTTFDGCWSTSHGGGLYILSDDITPTVTDCHFVNCSCESDGGGMFVLGAKIVVFACSFTGCRIDGQGSGASAYVDADLGDTLTCSETTSTAAFCRYNNWYVRTTSTAPRLRDYYGRRVQHRFRVLSDSAQHGDELRLLREWKRVFGPLPLRSIQ